MIDKLSAGTLVNIIDDLELDIDPFECEDTAELAGKVAEEVDLGGEPDDDEDEVEHPTPEEVNSMKMKELKKLIEEAELDIEIDDKAKVKKVRKMVNEAIAALDDDDDDDDDDDEGSEHSIADIKKMKKKELLALIEEEELEVDSDDWDNVKELRECVIEELDLEEDDE